ncbi:hypothetical protein BKA69DRAFT_1126525 [Paraphysoderma sedebokerense]|nr:hypothetical protein BKA69DRAFT_1126525 [Paraphysoderma sedebokerense]
MNSKEVVKFNFHSNLNSVEENVQVLIQQILDPSYGSYIWPSSYVLAQYIWRYRDKFVGKVVVELGSGTSLPSLLLSRLNPKLIVATDLMDPPHILENIFSSFKLNHGGVIPDNALIWGINWKEFFCPSRENCGTMELMKKMKDLNSDGVDYIIGADVLYNPEGASIFPVCSL